MLLAQETLRDRGGELSPDELFRVMWLATGDRMRADVARARRWLEMNRKS